MAQIDLMELYRRLIVVGVSIRLRLEVQALAQKLGMSRNELVRRALRYVVEKADADCWAVAPVNADAPHAIRRLIAAPPNEKVWQTEWN